jgi:hypothetical protein
MALRVIGAGWGRTGTASMQIALQRLGYPCHHMREVFSHPEHADLFREAATTDGPFDWERIYADYAATFHSRRGLQPSAAQPDSLALVESSCSRMDKVQIEGRSMDFNPTKEVVYFA